MKETSSIFPVSLSKYKSKGIPKGQAQMEYRYLWTENEGLTLYNMQPSFNILLSLWIFLCCDLKSLIE